MKRTQKIAVYRALKYQSPIAYPKNMNNYIMFIVAECECFTCFVTMSDLMYLMHIHYVEGAYFSNL